MMSIIIKGREVKTESKMRCKGRGGGDLPSFEWVGVQRSKGLGKKGPAEVEGQGRRGITNIRWGVGCRKTGRGGD